jgi:tetratricopeptide (TPR) repeat protein
MDQEHLSSAWSAARSGWSAYFVSVFAFLIPFFFIPNATYPFQFTKILLALAVVVLAFLAFSVKALRSRSFSLDWSWLSLSFIILPIVYGIAAIFSSVPGLSFLGYQFDQDTFGFITLASALALVTTLSIRSEGKIVSVLLGLLAGGWIAFLFQYIQILFGVPISFGLFTTPVQNLIGSWNDLALFASLLGSLSLLSLETLSLSTLRKIILGVTLLLSIGILALVNFSLAWILLGVVAFSTLIFSFMRPREEGMGESVRGTRSAASFVVLIAVVFFVLFGSGVSTSLQGQFKISSLDVSPSFQGTMNVLSHVYAKSPIFGSGPNTFGNQWFAARPPETLATAFWATEFNAGIGYIPTAVTTGGIVVALGWLLLIVLFVITAIRALLSAPASDERSYFLLATTAVGSAFLLVAHFFYDPSATMTLLLFLFLGLFVSSLRVTRHLRTLSVSFSESPRLGFLSVLLIAITLLLSLAAVYRVSESYAATIDASYAIVRSNANDIDGALVAMNRAIALYPNDLYYRNATAIELGRLNALVQSGANDAATQKAFQDGLAQAISFANQAVSFDGSSYANQMNRASVYEAVVPLGIQGASESAMGALEEARKLNPSSPEVDYQEAALKEFAKDHAGAKTSAEAAIAKKADYTPAILLLAQIALNQGNLNEAIRSLQSALVFNPGDSSLLYEIGLLELQNSDYQDAATAFQAAINASPDYANAKFFLAGADLFLGKKDEALSLLNEVRAGNEGNATLESVIAAVQKGLNPFASSTSPLPPGTVPAQ